jgi:hypothetical protein
MEAVQSGSWKTVKPDLCKCFSQLNFPLPAAAAKDDTIAVLDPPKWIALRI